MAIRDIESGYGLAGAGGEGTVERFWDLGLSEKMD
jgi:hypothetical protein